MFKNRKKTIGVRMPDNRITAAIVEELGPANSFHLSKVG